MKILQNTKKIINCKMTIENIIITISFDEFVTIEKGEKFDRGSCTLDHVIIIDINIKLTRKNVESIRTPKLTKLNINYIMHPKKNINYIIIFFWSIGEYLSMRGIPEINYKNKRDRRSFFYFVR